MARLTTYIKHSPSDDDLLTGSEYLSTGNDGIKNYTTANYKMSELAGYFASYFVQEGTPYNLATISANITTNTNNISANATYSTNLSSTFGTFDSNGNLQSLAQSFANQVFSTTSSTIFAQSSYVNNLASSFGTFDSSGNLQSLAQSFANTVMTTTNNSRFAESTYVNNLGSSFGTVAANGTVTISEAFANQVFTTTSNTDFATSSDVTALTARVGTAEGSISTQTTAIGRLDGYAEARHTMKLDANGAFAGFSILAQGGGTTDPYSEIRFVADKFKIYNGGSASLSGSYDAPFEVVNNVVKIKSANIGTVSFGDLSNVPSTFVTTVVYADNNSGSNASTTQGSRTFYALVQQSTAWSDGDSIPSGTVFNQITGSTGSNGNDAKTIKLTSSAFVVQYDAEGNNPNPSSITLTANSTNFTDGFYKFTGGGSVFTDETSFTDGTAANQDTATVTMPSSLFSAPLEFRAGVSEASQSEVSFDTINVVAVKPGQNGFTVVLSNESHTLPAASNGNVSSYTGSGTRIIVFDGATQYDSVTGTPGNNEFKVTATATTGTITIGTQNVGTDEAVFGDHSGMTSDLVIIEYTINIENTTTIKKYQTLTKSKQGLAGAAGANGAAGTDARVVNLTAGDLSFEYSAAGSNPNPSSVTVTATALNTSGTVYYEFFKNDVSLGSPGTANNFTYTPQSSFSNMPDKIEVQIREGATNNPILARDQITMIGIKPGTDGTSPYNAVLSNEAHTLPKTNAGTITYTGSGTTIDVFKGTTQLNSVSGTPGSGEFKVTATATNITLGTEDITGNPYVVGDHSSMNSTTANVSYSINCENTVTLTKVQSLSQSVEGDDGATGATGPAGAAGSTGATGARSISAYVFYSTPSTNAPSFNSSGVTFSFSNNTFSNLPSGWSQDAPEATPGSGSNNYWHIKATVTEGSPSNTITFGNVTRMFGFSGLVTFTGNSNETITDGTTNFNYTAIDGSNITTGNIASSNFSYSSGNFSSAGTQINLGTGRIRSENFAIDANGDAFFKGTITLGNTDLTETNTLNSNTTANQVSGLGSLATKNSVDATSEVTNLATVATSGDKSDIGLGNVADNRQTRTFRQNSVPVADNPGDIWIDTNDNNKMYVATAAGDDQITSGEWELANVNKTGIGLGNVDNTSDATILAGNLTGTVDGESASTVKSGAAAGATANQDSTATIRSVGAATSGTIAGWRLDGDNLYSGNQGNSPVSSGFLSGSGMTLNKNGTIHTKQFYIDGNGNAYFKGDLQAAGGTFTGTLSAAGGTFSGDIVVTGGSGSTNAPATITGLAAANDLNGRPTALLLKNSATTTGFDDSVALEMQSSARWHHVIQMYGGQDQDGNFDLSAEYRLGKSCTSAVTNCQDNFSTVKMILNGGGICIPDVAENAPSTYNPVISGDDFQYGSNIFFNSNNAAINKYDYGRMHLNEYYKTFFLDVPGGASHSSPNSTTYDNRHFSMRISKNSAGAGQTTGTWYSSEIMYIDTNKHLHIAEVYDIDNSNLYLDFGSTGDSLKVAGDVVAYVSSDKRYKDNIVNISNPLDKLNKINGVSFTWNEISHKETGKKDIGVIAQEIEEVFPEIVETRDNGYKAVDYPKLTALLIEAVKELSDKVKKLEDGITK